MHCIRFLPILAAMVLLASFALALPAHSGEIEQGKLQSPAGPIDGAIKAQLEETRQKYGMPAIAGCIVSVDGQVWSGVTGFRKIGTTVEAGDGDLWHLGSDTKAMTAILAAILMDEEKMKWGSTPKRVFPELAHRLHADVGEASVLTFLCHASGIQPDLDWNSEPFSGPVVQQRMEAMVRGLSKAPMYKPQAEAHYSNLGYVVVGAMTERVTGKSWEEALVEKVTGPLGMKSVGFGGTGTPGKIDQPWGHLENGECAPGNGPDMDNPPVLGPAGRVHCTIRDWARFAAEILKGKAGRGALLGQYAYNILLHPYPGTNFAAGWICADREWGGGTVYNHCGSNTMNYANAWLAPEKGFAVLVCANMGGSKAAAATDEAASKLIGLWLGSKR